ncbi:MAG: hypothetical protein E7Z70_07020 [Thermoplasmata archaeon]|jgi:hypothetical protein|nr:hypothetical protein [Thermoplasmata archaeon]MBR4685625.1 DUF5611 family protein [Candidatus Methanomethylophilaceae archaeon]WII06838.1 DUF5611 family protein [Methanomassiliicoccales archaeon LGM-RCC1]
MDYDIKKGWFKNIEGDALAQLMEQVFGNVKKDGDKYVSSYGVMESIVVTVINKDKMDITVTNVADAKGRSDDEIMDSKRKLNIFAEKATGFDAKARMKRAQKKAKEGTL